MNPVRSGVQLTYDDFVLFPEDGKRHELIDGEHYVTPSPNIKHQQVVGSLYFLIQSWLETAPGGVASSSPPSTSSSPTTTSSSRTSCTFRMRAPPRC